MQQCETIPELEIISKQTINIETLANVSDDTEHNEDRLDELENVIKRVSKISDPNLLPVKTKIINYTNKFINETAASIEQGLKEIYAKFELGDLYSSNIKEETRSLLNTLGYNPKFKFFHAPIKKNEKAETRLTQIIQGLNEAGKYVHDSFKLRPAKDFYAEKNNPWIRKNDIICFAINGMAALGITALAVVSYSSLISGQGVEARSAWQIAKDVGTYGGTLMSVPAITGCGFLMGHTQYDTKYYQLEHQAIKVQDLIEKVKQYSKN